MLGLCFFSCTPAAKIDPATPPHATPAKPLPLFVVVPEGDSPVVALNVLLQGAAGTIIDPAPSFASLFEGKLTLAPTYTDAGEYQVKIANRTNVATGVEVFVTVPNVDRAPVLAVGP